MPQFMSLNHPGHILADAVECHVIHHIEYVGGIHLAAAVHIGGGDLFRCQTAGVSYGNICHVIHGVENVGGVNAVAAVQVAFGEGRI